ncbi:hypothetical protein PGT21_034122 [Puccinia graminis f. sp. tritici]|uniref:Secreted protein n=2 Tax=Puccinia graminis f. sp. tritici TaxID=56615 RepID=A0A5B0NUF5_PUCGR|nr:hypothetical protein PGT21_034122 [Puccinia graminis f. sp. tritici]
MSIMNSFQKIFITFALVGLIIGLLSGQAAAREVQCDYHFAPLDGVNTGKGSCISSANTAQDNYCSLDYCGVRATPTTYTHWNNVQYIQCEGLAKVFVQQYFRYTTYVSAQDKFNGKFYKCYYQPPQNTYYISCTKCP